MSVSKKIMFKKYKLTSDLRVEIADFPTSSRESCILSDGILVGLGSLSDILVLTRDWLSRLTTRRLIFQN